MRVALAIPFVLVFIGLYFLASSDEYENQKIIEYRYNVMVCGGHWPDYKNRNPDCSELSNEKTQEE